MNRIDINLQSFKIYSFLSLKYQFSNISQLSPNSPTLSSKASKFSLSKRGGTIRGSYFFPIKL
jgi:hypothetical protein